MTQSREQLLAIEAFSSESFLMVNKKLIQIFGLNTAVFLSNLIDKYKYFSSRDMLQKDGGFFLTFEEQEKQIGLSAYQLGKCKKDLLGKRIIKTYMKGIPPKEFYIINFTKLIDIIEKKMSGNIPQKIRGIKPKKLGECSPKNSVNIKETRYKETKYNKNKSKNSISLKKKIRKRVDKKSNGSAKRFSSLTKQLINIVENNFGRTLPVNANTGSWTTAFRLLHQKEGIPIDKIEKIMDWYEDYAGKEYIPECQSGGSFREKFGKLEMALHRTTNQKPKTRKGGAKVIPGKYKDVGIVIDVDSDKQYTMKEWNEMNGK